MAIAFQISKESVKIIYLEPSLMLRKSDYSAGRNQEKGAKNVKKSRKKKEHASIFKDPFRFKVNGLSPFLTEVVIATKR